MSRRKRVGTIAKPKYHWKRARQIARHKATLDAAPVPKTDEDPPALRARAFRARERSIAEDADARR